jgi:hypothetical protein
MHTCLQIDASLMPWAAAFKINSAHLVADIFDSKQTDMLAG